MSAAPPPPPEPPRLYFDAVLQPYRWLSPSGFWLLMAVVCGASFSAGTGFVVIGAWPVCGLLGLEVVLIYLAFRLSYRGARLTETLQLNLSSHGRRLAIGSLLAPEERRQRARALRAALARQRGAACP